MNNLQKVLNSKRTKLTEIPDEKIDPCNFLTKETINQAYLDYKKQIAP